MRPQGVEERQFDGVGVDQLGEPESVDARGLEPVDAVWEFGGTGLGACAEADGKSGGGATDWAALTC